MRGCAVKSVADSARDVLEQRKERHLVAASSSAKRVTESSKLEEEKGKRRHDRIKRECVKC